MPRNSLPSLRAQIAKLEQKAETIKRQVVSRLQREIQAHGLTAEDLFGGGSAAVPGRRAKVSRVASSTSQAERKPKYGDGKGNVWGGMGKRPQWLKDRLEAGATLEEFLLGSVSKPATKATKKPSKGAARSASTTAPKKVATRRTPAAKKKAPTPRRKRKAAAAEPTTEI
jgi:DNA-binding protein H-NS